MKSSEEQYLSLLKNIVHEGELTSNRTGVDTLSLWGLAWEHNIDNGNSFPLLTTKAMSISVAFSEISWILRGSSDMRYLWDNNCHIWDGNYYSESWQTSPFYEQYSVGKGYGYQMRNFNGKDQLKDLLYNLEHEPFSRRNLISLWNPGDLDKTALPPCHFVYHFKVHNDKRRLSLIMTQRSADFFFGGSI